MNTYITLGKVTVSFRDESATLCLIRRADHYKREKPKGWGEEDFYLVTHEAGEIYANFSGEGTIEVNGESYGILPINKMPLKKSSNKIIIHSGGRGRYRRSYTFILHLVMCRQKDASESHSKGISYNTEQDLWVFDEITFFDSLFWLWQDACQDDYVEELSVEGYLEGEQEDLGENQGNQEIPAGHEDLSLEGQSESVQDTTSHHSSPLEKKLAVLLQ